MSSRALTFYRAPYRKAFEERQDLLKKRDVVAICTDTDSLFERFDQNLVTKEVWDYFERNELARIDKTALEFAQSWYLWGEEDWSRHKGISVGEMIQYEVMTFFVASLRAVALNNRLFDRECIDEVIVFSIDSLYEQAACILARKRGLRITKIEGGSTSVATPTLLGKWRKWADKLRLWATSSVLRVNQGARFALLLRQNVQNTVLFVSPYRLLELIRKLTEDGGVYGKLITSGYVVEMLGAGLLFRKNIEIDAIPRAVNALDSSAARTAALRIYQRLAPRIDELLQSPAVSNIKELVRKKVSEFLLVEMTKAISQIAMLEGYLAKHKPNALVVVQDFCGIQRIAAALCKRDDVFTLVLQHGAVGFYPHFVAPISKRIGVWDTRWAKWYTENLGIKEDRIEVVGDPYYDRFLSVQEDLKKPALRRRYRLPDKRIILYAHQYAPPISSLEFPRLDEYLAYVVCKEMAGEDDYWLVVKLRPGESCAKGWEIAKQAGAANVTVISKANNLSLLRACDLVLTRSSTMAFEGMLLDKPVAILNLPPRFRDNSLNPFLDTRAIIEIRDQTLIRPMVKSVFDQPEVNGSLSQGRADFVRRFYHESGKSSAQRIADLLARNMRRE